MSDQGNGQWPQQPDPQNRPDGQAPQQGSAPNTGGHRLPGGNTGGQQVPGGQPAPGGDTGGQWSGGQQVPGGDTGGQWSGGQQQWGGQQPPWASSGQEAQPPSWSTGQTGPNVGPTMNNPQSSYYDRFSAASGEGVQVPQGGGGGGGRGKVLLGLAGALVIIVAAVAVFAFTRGDDSPTEAGGSSSTRALPPVKATTWVNPTLAVGARPLKSGWQAQQANDSRGVFDVPATPDWELRSRDTWFGYADPRTGETLVITKAPALYGEGYCSQKKSAEIAWLGLVNVGKRDPSDAGPDIAQRFADAISIKEDGSHVKEGEMSAPKQIKVNQGTIPALQYTITTPVGDPDECDKGKHYEVRTVTFSSGGKSYQLVSVRITDGPKTLSTETLDEIISTFRPSN